MINWRDVRSYSDLERFLWAFSEQNEEQQEEILSEMTFAIAFYRENEDQRDLFKDQGVKASTSREKPLRKSRGRRPRR